MALKRTPVLVSVILRMLYGSEFQASSLRSQYRRAAYCDQRVCLSLRSRISTTTSPTFTKFTVRAACSGRRSVLL